MSARVAIAVLGCVGILSTSCDCERIPHLHQCIKFIATVQIIHMLQIAINKQTNKQTNTTACLLMHSKPVRSAQKQYTKDFCF